MPNYFERLKDKLRIKKIDSQQPIRAWIFVICLNFIGLAGYLYLKLNHIELNN